MDKNHVPDELARQIDHLFERVRQLYDEGRHQKAIAIANHIRELAHRRLG